MNVQKEKIIIASGYFNPFHVGHLEYLQLARQLGDRLIVIVNNDEQVKLKGSYAFMSEKDRLKIISALKCVDEVFLSIDRDSSVCKSIEFLKKSKGVSVFAKGGDKNIGNIPEKEICSKLKIQIVDGLGKKIRASSDLIKNSRKK